MLKEIIENLPLSQENPALNLNQIPNDEFFSLINEKCGINLAKTDEPLTLSDIQKLIDTTHEIYTKILNNENLKTENKTPLANSVMAKLFDFWRNSDSAELFFKKIQQKFTPAQITAALLQCTYFFEKFKPVMNFFTTHKHLFPQNTDKIRTLGVYYNRIYNGGIERFLSLIIPVYIKLGYRVVLFTDEIKPEMEYPIPPQDEKFAREVFKTPRSQTLNRLTEWAELLKKHEIDAVISNMRSSDFPAHVQFWFLKLSGVKTIMQLHGSMKLNEYRFPNLLSYPIADAMIVLSKARMNLLKSYGARAFYIPNPVMFKEEDKTTERDPKKVTNTILWVGRISPVDKNPYAVISIMKAVVTRIPNAKLKVVGSADNPILIKNFEQLIKSNNLENNIELCGYHTDVRPFYETADLMLSTAVSEGWSLVIAESKFYELPLVLYELPDNELVSDGKGCISVPQNGSIAAANAIIRILTNKRLRCQLATQARESIQYFMDYDIEGAWKNVFDAVEANEPLPTEDNKLRQFQDFLLEENMLLQRQVQNFSLQAIKK